MYIELDNNELQLIEGGAFAGGLVGGIFGGCVGIVGACVKCVATGKLSANELWKLYTSCALTGAAVGVYIPI